MKDIQSRVFNLGPDVIVRVPADAARAAGFGLGDTVGVRVESRGLFVERVRDADGANDIALAMLSAGPVTSDAADLALQQHAPHLSVEDVVFALDRLVAQGKVRMRGTTARSLRYVLVPAKTEEPPE